jgi:hypothetical protein
MDTQNIENFKKVVLAGMKLMYDEKTFELFANGMKNKKIPLPERLAMEAAGLMKMLADKSNGKIPPEIIAPAAAMLLMEMAKFMKDSGLEKPTGADVEKATMMLMDLLKKVLGGKQAAQPQPPAAPPPPQAPAQPQPRGLLQGA